MANISVEQILKKAKTYERKGEFTEAQKLYEKVLQTFPKNIRAELGLINLMKLRKDEIKQNPPVEVMNQIVNFFNTGQFLNVVELAQALTKRYSNSFFIWNILGASATEIGEIDKAIDAYKKAILIKPDYADAYNNMGVALEKKGNLDDAIKLYKKAILLKKDYAIAYNNLGNAFKDQDKLDEAMLAYQKAILLKPNYAEAYNNLGNAFKDQGKLDEALDACHKSISFKPNYALAYNNMGSILSDQNNLEASLKAFKEAISLKPEFSDPYNNMGNIFKYQGKLDEAITSYEKAISLNPAYADAYSNLANIFEEQGKLDKAIDAYKTVISLNPFDALAYNNMGNVFTVQRNVEKAIEAYKNAISLKPNYALAYNNLGIALKDLGDLEKAIEAFKKAISLKPDYATAYSNIGNILKDQGKLDMAIASYEKAISHKPDYADAFCNMGVSFKHQGDFDKAIKAYKKALFLQPDFAQAHLNFGITLLNTGRIKEGFNEYEWRWRTSDFLSLHRHFPKPMWDGQISLKDKTIFLWSEQGIGDTMNWSSCLPLLTSRSKHVILECQEKLVPLLKRSFPNVEVKAENKSLDIQRDDFDLHLPMGSLYKHFIDEIMENDKADSYLVPDPARVKFWKERLRSVGNGPYIGLCWKSSVVSAYRLQHYPPISEWSPVLKVPDITFINLQYVNYEDDIAKVLNEFGVTIQNFKDIDQYEDIDEVAALCGALDMVVSTKATPPMISAGVGTPTKIANWKKSSYNNILNNPQSSSLEMINRDTSEPWGVVFNRIAQNISRHAKNLSA